MDPGRPLPELAGRILIVRWRWKLQRVGRTAGLCSELSRYHLIYTPAVEEKDYYVMYSIDGSHLTFNKADHANSLACLSFSQVSPVHLQPELSKTVIVH
jgi:hypothetical protein